MKLALRYRSFWRIRTLSILVLAASSLFAAISVASDRSVEKGEDAAVVAEFERVRSEIEESLRGEVPCFDFATGSPSCGFAAMCSKLAEAGSSAYLYENSAGERIPNFALFGAEMGIAYCHSLIQAEKLDVDQAMAERAKATSDHQKRVREASRRFHDSIKRNREEAVWFDIQWQQMEDLAEKGGAMGMAFGFGLKREDVERDLLATERKVGQSLSKETRDAWVESQILMFNPPPLAGSLGHSHSGPSEWKALNTNPFLNLDLFINAKAAGGVERVRANQAQYQKEAERSYKIFRDVQQDIIRYLESKRTPENGADIENLKARISTVAMSFLPLNPATTGQMAGMFGCPGPNAFYNPENHSFVLCPQIMQMPTGALQAIVAHELAHAIDPCTPTDALVTIEGERRPAVDFMGNVMDEKKMNEMRIMAEKAAAEQGIYVFEAKLPDGGGVPDKRDMRVNFLNSLNDANLRTQYKTFQKKELGAAMPFSKHPFQSTIRCLAGRDSIRARIVGENEAAAELDEWIRSQRESGATPEKSAALASMMKAREDVGRLLQERGGCSFIPGSKGNSQVQEAFADKLASEIMARKASRSTPADARRLAFEASSFFLSLECPGIGQKVQDSVEAAFRKTGCAKEEQNKDMKTLNALIRSMKTNRDEHSKSADRINRILLVHPDLRKAAGCGAERGVRYCE